MNLNIDLFTVDMSTLPDDNFTTKQSDLTSMKAKFCSKLICAAITGLPGAVFNFASCILALKNSIIKL